MYLARWSILVDGNDPKDVARRATTAMKDPNLKRWTVIDLEDGTTTSVEVDGV